MGDVFKDHFSGHARAYRSSRPSYPAELFAWLASRAPASAVAVDLGCGNGQASCGLAERFRRVIALDPSSEQIAQAEAHPRIAYGVAAAEQTGLPATSADAVLAAQSFHWFDHPRFFPELRRIARPGGLFAAVAYCECTVTAAVDAVVHELYHEVLAGYWPAERRHVEDRYRTLPFPLDELAAPEFPLVVHWDLAQLRGYLGSWSALQAWQRRRGSDPRLLIDRALAQAWGEPALPRAVRWSLVVRAGILPGDAGRDGGAAMAGPQRAPAPGG
jgi:SAM-dependent methyltransferase